MKAITFAFHRLLDSSAAAVAIVVAQLLPVLPSFIAVPFTFLRMYRRILAAASGSTPTFTPPRPELIDVAITQGSTLANFLLMGLFSGGVFTIALRVARGEPTGFGDILAGVRFYPRILAVGGCTGGLFFLGGLLNQLLGFAGVDPTLALLGLYIPMIPAFYLVVVFMLAIPLILDRDLGAMDALRESARLTKGHRINLAVLLLIICVIAMMGVCACCVGVLVSWPLYSISLAFAYLRITGQPTREG